jgi:hypothetical protein
MDADLDLGHHLEAAGELRVDEHAGGLLGSTGL